MSDYLFRSFAVRLSALSVLFTILVSGIALPSGNDGKVVSREVSLQVSDLPRRVGVPISANMLGFGWQGKKLGEVEFRIRDSAGWGEWHHAVGNPDEGPDVTSKEHQNRTTTAPVWIGGDAQEVELRFDGPKVSEFKMYALRSDPGSSSWRIAAASAGPAQPAILSRAEWGADESLRKCGPDYADNVRYGIVHHTATSNSYTQEEAPAIIRGIYHYHTQTNGWCDIGYNFIVDRFGRAYEGRFGGITRPVIGAHAGGFNTGSTGMALLGSFDSDPVPAAARSTLRSLLAWKLDLHGVNANSQILVVSGGSTRYPAGTVVTLWTISGHRDVSSTVCPGRFLYDELPALRAEVQREMDLSGLSSSPAVSSWAPGRLDILARGESHQLTHKWWDGRAWFAWESLGGVIVGDPAAVSWGSNRIDVFVRGTDDALWHAWWDGRSWGGWESLGGILASGPDAASWASGRLDVVVKGTDGGLWQIFYDGARWSGWTSLGGTTMSDPAAVSWGSNRLDVMVRGTDERLWHKFWNGTQWSGWDPVGLTLASGPSASSWGPGRIDAFGRTSEGLLSHAWFDGGKWQGLENLGGALTNDPAAASWSFNRIDVFAKGGDGALWQAFWDGARWAWHRQ